MSHGPEVLLSVEVAQGDPGAPSGSLADRLLKAGFSLTLDLLMDDATPEDSYDDLEAIAQVRAAMESGDPWAWFLAKVSIAHPDAPECTGTDYLGACGGYSRASFMDPGPGSYWPDMVATAWAVLKGVASQATSIYEAIADVDGATPAQLEADRMTNEPPTRRQIAEALREASRWISKANGDGAFDNCALPLAAGKCRDKCDAIAARLEAFL